MNVGQITERLEQIAPVSYAESWDNVGLLVGSEKKEVSKIMIALDATDQVIEQAVTKNIDLLITHHPMIFSAMKRINEEDFIGRRVIQLIRHDISYYAMHTNCDVCIMNQEAADRIGLQAEDVLEYVKDGMTGEAMGIGKIGMLKNACTVGELAELVKQAFHVQDLRLTGLQEQKVQKVAISTGAGKSMVNHAIQKGAQVLITGDIDHHTAIDALAQGLQIIDAGHFGTEHFMVDYVGDYLRKTLNGKAEIYLAQEQSPFLSL